MDDIFKTNGQQFGGSFQDEIHFENAEEPSIAEEDASVLPTKTTKRTLRLPLKTRKQPNQQVRLSIFENEMKSGADVPDQGVTTHTPPKTVLKMKAPAKLPSIRHKCNSTDVTKASLTSANMNSPYHMLTVPGVLGQQTYGSHSSLDLDECELASAGTPFLPQSGPKQFQFSHLPLREVGKSFVSQELAADKPILQTEGVPTEPACFGFEISLPGQDQTRESVEDGHKSIWNDLKKLPSIQPTQISIPRETSLGTITREKNLATTPSRLQKDSNPKKIKVLRRSDTIELQQELDFHQRRGASIDLDTRKHSEPTELRKSESVAPSVDQEYKTKVSRWLFSKNSLNSLPQREVLKHIEHMRKDYEEARRFQKPAHPLNKVILSKVDRSNQEADLDKKFLVLDLDETLVSAKFEGDSANQKVFDPSKVKITIRPFAKEFLRDMSELWNVIVFTASDKKYADYVVDMLDPECKYIANVCYRNQCEAVSRHLVKDLRSFYSTHVKEENILIVDNRIVSFGYQIYNGIPILPFYGDLRDTELRGLKSYLKRLSQPEFSIQKTLRDRYRYSETFKFAS